MGNPADALGAVLSTSPGSATRASTTRTTCPRPRLRLRAAEIVEDLQAALGEFAAMADTLQQARDEGQSATGRKPHAAD
ncbi:hypothetical protein [Streptomyces sviceus]|uniref:hypothetical protein n=1 Tax=Streptomyces sviceus TaxID=285530 RepID=UPI0036E9E4EB